MKKIIFGIFAHPDDESFGPSATLMKAVDEGAELHLVVLTNGQAGVNLDGHTDLGMVRLAEWQRAADLIGATSATPLGYADGYLSHHLYPEIGEKLHQLVCGVLRPHETPVELSFMTFEPHGLTGHLDHIAASFLTTQLFHTIQPELPAQVTVTELAYYCLSTTQVPGSKWKDYFTPLGREDSYINRRVDVRELLPRKYEVMRQHYTQRRDAATLMATGDDRLATDHFHVMTATD